MDKQGKLFSLLIDRKFINQEKLDQLKNLAKVKNKNIEEILAEEKIIDIESLTKIKSEVFNLPYKNLAGKKIVESALNIISLEVAENYKIICFEKEDNTIKVGIIDPDDFKAIEAVDFLAKEGALHVEYYLISKLSFDSAIRQYKTLIKEIYTALESKAEEEALSKEKLKREKEKEVEEITKSAPVAKIVSVIIRHAVEGRASDIHIEPILKESRVRYRIDGILHTSLILPKSVHSAIVARVKVLANLKLDETRIPQDGRFSITVNDKEIDLRISVLPLLDEEKVVMRILDVSKGAPSLVELGFIGNGLEIIRRNIKRTDGMFLVTGPTGSGKSTTLFSVLNEINKEGINIVTLEDPIEYFIKGINQSLIRPEIGFTFASGLRSLLRQDPNVIMVGEIRDNETAELAIHASLTGHLVLSTLHTNDALGAIPRLIDMKIEPFLLGSTLKTVVAQRLCRVICQYCKSEYKLPATILSEIKSELDKIPDEYIKETIPSYDLKKLRFYKGKGCPRCGNSGYIGRIALTEVFEITDRIKEKIIVSSKNLNIDDLVNEDNFITMEQDGIIKVIKGITTMEEVMRTVHN